MTVLIAFALSTFSYASEVRTHPDSLAHIQGKLQPAEIKGRPNADRYPGLNNVIVTLYYHKDGQIDSLQTISDSKGLFIFRNLEPQRIGLKLQMMGRKTIQGVYDIETGENAFFFYMERKKEELAAATVTAEIPLMKQLQDTTVYNTKAVKTLEDDNLATVLESLPGFEVSEKGVTVNGVSVRKTYVNGHLVFGDGVMTALNVLKAKEVTQVKVYDEQNAVDKHRGLKNSQKERVLDIITKEDFLSAFKAAAGTSFGADETGQLRYGASAEGRYDSDMLNISIWGGATNLTEGRPVGASAFIYAPTSLGNYMEAEGVNASVAKYWKDRNFGNKLSAVYDFSHTYRKSSSVAMNEYFKTDDNPAMKQLDTLLNSTNSLYHSFDVRGSFMDTPIKSIVVGVSGNFEDSNNDAFNGTYKITEGMPDERRHETSSANNRDYTIKGDLSWTNNDPVKWRPSVSVDGSYSNNNHLSWTVDTLATSYLKRQLKSEGLGQSAKANAQLDITGVLLNTEKKTVNASFGASANYTYSKSRQMSLDEWDVPSPVCDTASSYDFTNHYINATAYFKVQYSDAKQRNVNFTLSSHFRQLIDNEYFPFDFNASKYYIAPEFKLVYKSKQRFSLDFSGDMETPAVEQIRNRISDSNPMILTGGNPNLKYSYNLRLYSKYTFFNKRNPKGLSHSLTLSGDASCTLRPIVQMSKYFYTETVLDQWDGYKAKAGSMLYTYLNSDMPYWSVSINMNYSGGIRNKFYYRTAIAGSYRQTPQYAYSKAIQVKDANTGITLNLGFKPSKKLNLSVTMSPDYINSRDDSGTVLSSRFSLYDEARLTWAPLRWLSMGGAYVHQGYLYVDGHGIDHHNHNLSANINFIPLKDRSLKIKVTAGDLLNSGSTYTSSVTASGMFQSWTPVYGRFYLATVIYEFRHKNTVKRN